MTDKERQYRRELQNWLVTVKQTVDAVQRDQLAPLDEKIKALDLIHTQIANVKRALIFLKNTAEVK